MSAPVVLVSDVDHRKAFDIVSSLRRSVGRYELLLASSAPGEWGRWVYGSRVHALRKNSWQPFAEDLDRLTATAVGITYLPVEEDTTRLFLRYVQERPTHRFRFVLPDQASFELARDKAALSVFCHDRGIPVPRLLGERDLSADGRLPEGRWVLKPRHGMGSKGVRYLRGGPNGDRLDASVFTHSLVQERIGNPQTVEGAFVLCRDGEVIDFYSHERLRTAPATGGVSVLSVSRNNLRLLDTVRPLAAALDWSGIMMVELLFDPNDGAYKVIEVNPRLWGSILLAEFCDSRLLHNYIRLANGREAEGAFAATAGRHLRWVVPHDILHYVRRLGRVNGFWRRGRGDTCYVNFTFAPWVRAWCFMAFLAMDLLRRGGKAVGDA